MRNKRKSTMGQSKPFVRPVQTIHGFVEGMLKRTKKPYVDIAAEARKAFKSHTSPASVRHYASKLRQSGVKVPERKPSREFA
jgi:hypothetical protein